MLDTDTCSYIMRGEHPSIINSMRDKAENEHILCMSVITYQELKDGAAKAKTPNEKIELRFRIHQVCEMLHYVAEWTEECADQFFITQAAMLEKSVPIDEINDMINDVMIAAHAIVLNATIVTNNKKDFLKIKKSLPLENWVTHGGDEPPQA